MSPGDWAAAAVEDAALAGKESSQVWDRRGGVQERAHSRSEQAEGPHPLQAQRRAGVSGHRLQLGAVSRAAALVFVCAHSVAAFGFAPSLAPMRAPIAALAPNSPAHLRAAKGRLPGAGGGGLLGVTSVLLKPASSSTTDGWGKRLPAVETAERPALPRLTDLELRQLERGERVQRQMRRNLIGQGLVVVDVKADLSTVMSVLSDIERYPSRIETVRTARIVPGSKGADRCRAEFSLSRFHLQVGVNLRLRREMNLLEFSLDRSRQFPPPPFEEAQGFWFVEPSPERAGYSRIWLSSKVTCSPLLPAMIVDYAAARALPRATTWLRREIEQIARRFERVNAVPAPAGPGAAAAGGPGAAA
mmetsp:Transcript_3840/g.8764  ORF Transcript_3840/g.8764 Transcript_3840/m.8764 type:complete len:360 (+) Transcript_3840:181-1260(+)